MRVSPRTGLRTIIPLLAVLLVCSPVNAQSPVLNSDPDFDQFYTTGNGDSGAWKPFKLSNPGPIIWKAPVEGWPKGPSLWIYADSTPYDGGVYQLVPVTPGRSYHFEVAWAVVRHGGAAVHEDSQLIRRVGIDPYGGSDAASSNVQWSVEYTGSGKFAPELAIDEAALADHITLFLRAQNRYTDARNEVFFDHAVMSLNAGVPPIQVALPTQTPASRPSATARPAAAAGRTRVAQAAPTATPTTSPTTPATATPAPTATAAPSRTPTESDPETQADTETPPAPDRSPDTTRLALVLGGMFCLGGSGGIVLLGLLIYLLRGR